MSLNHKSIEETKQFFTALVALHDIDGDGYEHGDDLRISTGLRDYKGRERIEVTVTRMYSRINLKFAHLKAVSEFYGTDCIDIDNDIGRGGCETCDYGSSYGFTLTIG